MQFGSFKNSVHIHWWEGSLGKPPCESVPFSCLPTLCVELFISPRCPNEKRVEGIKIDRAAHQLQYRSAKWSLIHLLKHYSEASSLVAGVSEVRTCAACSSLSTASKPVCLSEWGWERTWNSSLGEDAHYLSSCPLSPQSLHPPHHTHLHRQEGGAHVTFKWSYNWEGEYWREAYEENSDLFNLF